MWSKQLTSAAMNKDNKYLAKTKRTVIKKKLGFKQNFSVLPTGSYQKLKI